MVGPTVDVAPGGDGLVVGRGRVRQARKVPVRPVMAGVAVFGLIVAGLAFGVAWVAATLAPRWELLGAVGPVAASVFVVALMVVVVALVGLVLVVALPYETWGLYNSGADRFDRRVARRLARWWPRKSGQVMDSVRGDDGRFYRPSLRAVDWVKGHLVLVLVLPRVLKGTDLDPYFSRFEALGPEIFALHEVKVKTVVAGYWATVARVEVVHTDCAATTRSVLDRLGVSS